VSRPHRRLLLTYAASIVVVIALLPLGDRIDGSQVAIALGLLVLAGAGLTASATGHGYRATTLVSLLLILVATALLRNGVGSTAGFGPLVFLAVLWAALEQRRTELVLVLIGIALVYYLPPLVAPGPHYPASSWRGGTFMLVVAIALGYAALSLVASLRDESERSKAILDAMTEGFALTRNGEIVSVNPALCAITGFSEQALLGSRAPFPFWPPESRDVNAELLRQVVADGGGVIEIDLLRADGARFPASISAIPTDLGDGNRCFLNTVRDLTEPKAHQAAQRHHVEQLAAITDVIREIGHSDPLDARPTICRLALRMCKGAHAVSLWEVDPDGTLATTATRPETTSPYRITADQIEHGARVVMASGEPLFVPDARTSPNCDRRIIDLLGAASVLFHPIADARGVRGALAISWPEPLPALADGDAMMVGVLAGEAAIAMQRADLLGRLDEQTRTDELTGLPNRRAWDELLTEELALAQRHGAPLSVAMLDLDFFKRYNDERGHLAGDRLLREAAAAWAQSLRATDVLARWGGEEFALLLPSCDGPCAAALVERLRGMLPDGVTFSAGVASSDGTTAPRTLVDAADQALYLAKAGGRDRVVIG
jgi:diguanylate cyclase (GGDEF)-like protein/PAS domain S-box-containing protein